MGSNYDNADHLQSDAAITNSVTLWDNCAHGGGRVVAADGAHGEYEGLLRLELSASGVSLGPQ